MNRAPVINGVISQHFEEAATLWNTRRIFVAAGSIGLADLHRFDGRIAAHLDGLLVAGEQAWSFYEASLEAPSAGKVFTSTAATIEARRDDRLNSLFALTEVVPETRAGLTSALGWLERARLQGTVVGLLAAPDSFRRMVGIAACAMHRVDPGIVSARRLQDTSPEVRARALRAVGELGLRELISTCSATIEDDDPDGQFWAVWSAVLLGDRNRALEALTRMGLTASAHRPRAFRLAFQALSLSAAHSVLQQVAGKPEQLCSVIQGSGICGDPAYVPWLIKQMTNDRTARLAGEAFSLITGADLSRLNLERPQPENFEGGPNDDPNDPNVEMNPDDGLPWPDGERVERWWAANGTRFQNGMRYFMGAPVTREHCIEVLKNGYQRQRILAAHYLCLLNPGTPLFNTSAPAWRQQKLLAQME